MKLEKSVMVGLLSMVTFSVVLSVDINICSSIKLVFGVFRCDYLLFMSCARSLTPDTEGTHCHFEEVQHRPCSPGTCPPLCLLDNQTLSVGDTWLQGECKQW